MTKFSVLIMFLLIGCYVPEELTTYYRDKDKDGYGDENITVEASQRPEGYVGATDVFDCNDASATIRPFRNEIKYGHWIDVDVNCNGSLDD